MKYPEAAGKATLTLQNSKVIPYETRQGNSKLNDTYADDLTLYLKYFPLEKHNKRNIKRALDCFDSFSNWSGLKINKKKTYVTIFGGKKVPKPPFVGELGLNYCDSFTLLGVVFDPTLSCMRTNYDEGLRKMEIVANDWRYKYLTIFGKITVIKTFMLSTLSHIATILPTPPISYCKRFEEVRINFIKGEHKATAKDEASKGKTSIVSPDVVFGQKKYNGLGL